jgi:hypothetical protein
MSKFEKWQLIINECKSSTLTQASSLISYKPMLSMTATVGIYEQQKVKIVAVEQQR